MEKVRGFPKTLRKSKGSGPLDLELGLFPVAQIEDHSLAEPLPYGFVVAFLVSQQGP